MIKNAKEWLLDNRVIMLYTITAGLAFSILYLYRLGSFIRGDSIYETKAYLGIDSINSIIDEISFAPIKVIQFILTKIDDGNSTILRLISVLIVLISLVAFYRLISRWHTVRIAILATLLVATSSFTLHLGRFTSLDAIYFIIFPLILLSGTWLKSKKYVVRMPYILPILAILLYLPGFIYLIILLPVIFRKRLLLAWKHVDIRKNLVSLGLSAFILVPLVFSLLVRPSQIYEYLAIDRIMGDNGIREFLNTLANIPQAMLYSNNNDAFKWLIGSPVLDIASVVLFILGIYGYIKGPHTLRARIILIFGIISLIIISTGTLVTITLLLPLIYIIIANGLVYLLESWFTVFPRNPAARNTALSLIFVFVMLICSYHLQRYFIAWPNSPETKSALSAKTE